MKRYLAVGLLMIVPLYGLSRATEELVKSMVPRGEVAQKLGNNFAMKTSAGTRIMVEFDHSGSLDEASGLNLNKGDDFEPGNGLISLSSAAQIVSRLGHQLNGIWNLEKDLKKGWVYEIEGTKEDEPVSYLVDAKKSQIINDEN